VQEIITGGDNLMFPCTLDYPVWYKLNYPVMQVFCLFPVSVFRQRI
jgi:hypothetical protein